jgi:FKBP-type peptidyl-prolyl cis-trans isomerase
MRQLKCRMAQPTVRERFAGPNKLPIRERLASRKTCMKHIQTLLVGAACVFAFDIHAADQKPLTTQKEKASYGIGMNVGKRFSHEFIDLDMDAFMRGFKDALTDAKPALTEAELTEALANLRKDVEKKTTEQAATNKKAGEEFLAKNKGAKGVVTTASGLQYSVLKEGTGATPKETDTVEVHYRGTLLDGTEFDNSYKRNEPAVFPVNGVIPGWVEALKLMKTGSKWKLFIPSNLAYGESGQPGIPPNSVLVFEVELLGIKKSAE